MLTSLRHSELPIMFQRSFQRQHLSLMKIKIFCSARIIICHAIMFLCRIRSALMLIKQLRFHFGDYDCRSEIRTMAVFFHLINVQMFDVLNRTWTILHTYEIPKSEDTEETANHAVVYLISIHSKPITRSAIIGGKRSKCKL